MIALLTLLLAAPAHALTSHQSGPSLDLAAGLGLRGTPLRPGVGGDLSLGWWAGTYDDQYAFGKYWWLGATGRVDWRPGGARRHADDRGPARPRAVRRRDRPVRGRRPHGRAGGGRRHASRASRGGSG
ncbi:MAG: hypothetical protein R3F59_00560 [Myxococcota bacterium]